MESESSWPGPPSATLTTGIVRTGWEISHCPTIFASFASSAAMVTVWLVTITGNIFAWLWVIEENKKMAEGSERKNPCAAAKKIVPNTPVHE